MVRLTSDDRRAMYSIRYLCSQFCIETNGGGALYMRVLVCLHGLFLASI